MSSLCLETTATVSVAALNVGEFAIACDLCRCFLKLSQASDSRRSQTDKTDALVFITRGLSFACMGV
jgi:hypothetical protein